MVAGHLAWPKKFQLGQVSFLTGQNIGKKVNLSFCNFYFVNTIVFFSKKQNLRFTGEDLAVFVLNESACVTSQHVQW